MFNSADELRAFIEKLEEFDRAFLFRESLTDFGKGVITGLKIGLPQKKKEEQKAPQDEI